MNVQEVANAMSDEAGFERVLIEASAVAGSPHEYVYVYLTEGDEYEGLHLILSDAAELGGEGIVIGLYPHYEEGALKIETVNTVAEAVTTAKEWTT